jgi:hypothetical protein
MLTEKGIAGYTSRIEVLVAFRNYRNFSSFSVAFSTGQTLSEECVERSSSELGSAGRNVPW